jgi:glycosyltransferase involved in cell wall biosynthesis
LKVLQVQSYFHPAVHAGGPAFSTLELSKGLAEAGLEVTVYTTNLDAGRLLEVPVNRMVALGGMRVYYHPVWGGDRYLFSPSLWRRLHREIGTFDLVHLHETWTFPILAAAAYCRWRRVPYVISPRGTLDGWSVNEKYLKKKVYFELLAKAIYEHASLVHFTAAQEQAGLSPRIPFKLGPHVIIPNPVPLEEYEELPPKGAFYHRLGLNPVRPIVLFVGRLHKKKGLELLLRAFSRLQQEKAVLAIVGPDERGYQKELEKLVTKLSLTERVRFTGPLVGPDKLAAYRDSALLALPSHQENFGMVVAEAMAAELPVVISEFINIANEVSARGAGLVLPLKEDGWVEALDNLLKNREAGRRMGRAGRQLVREEYAAPRVAEKMAAAYRGIGQKSSP